MAAQNVKQLHWTQRIALVRHNLHAASRSGSFCFFKTLQACGFMEGTNHAATLSSTLGDDADGTQVALDNINASLALAFQDSFEKVHDSLKNSMDNNDGRASRSKLCSDIALQKDANDLAIDRLINSATALIDQLTPAAQDHAANVWITGVTIIADSIEVTTQEMQALDFKSDDLMQMEDSWNTVKASVVSAVAGVKGIFSLMDPSEASEPPSEKPSRSMSIASASSSIFRRFSNAFQTQGSHKPNNISAPSSPTGPISVPKPTHQPPNYSRNNFPPSHSVGMPIQGGFNFHKLSTTPATPMDEPADPFDTSRILPFPDMAASPISIEQRAVKQTVA